MTSSAGWVQSSRQDSIMGGSSLCKVAVRREPFLAPKAVTLGLILIGPWFLIVVLVYSGLGLGLTDVLASVQHRYLILRNPERSLATESIVLFHKQMICKLRKRSQRYT